MNQEQAPFHKLPSRIRHYLLEWKDDHLDEYINKYGELKLKDLSIEQIRALFGYATGKEVNTFNKEQP